MFYLPVFYIFQIKIPFFFDQIYKYLEQHKRAFTYLNIIDIYAFKIMIVLNILISKDSYL